MKEDKYIQVGKPQITTCVVQNPLVMERSIIQKTIGRVCHKMCLSEFHGVLAMHKIFRCWERLCKPRADLPALAAYLSGVVFALDRVGNKLIRFTLALCFCGRTWEAMDREYQNGGYGGGGGGGGGYDGPHRRPFGRSQ